MKAAFETRRAARQRCAAEAAARCWRQGDAGHVGGLGAFRCGARASLCPGIARYNNRGDPMDKIATCLWFDGKAEEAAKFYTGIFKSTM
jgi:hypothetical protein